MDHIIKVAVDARQNAHAPYSRYDVGAAVETTSGTVIGGCNVESSSFGLTICAERVALGAAVTQGYKSFKAMAIASRNGAAPCGACRQVIWDLCGNIPITLVNEEGKETTVWMSELFPRPFDDSNLE